MKVFGIDPGLKGAFAVVDLETDDAQIFDMPVVDFVDGRPVPDVYGIAQIINSTQPDMFIVEHVEARPHGKTGAASQWRFAAGFGATLAACQLTGVRGNVALVRPPIWKAALKVTAEKDTSLNLARELFPQSTDMLKRKKDDGRAEALLLVEYYRRVVIPTGEVEVI